MANPQPIPAVTKGPQHAVPCPHCGHPNDFRELDSHRIETGDKAACDRCNGVMEIVQIRPVTIVAVRRSTEVARREPGTKQSTTISAGQARKLIGR